jgi:hypothetical protein
MAPVETFSATLGEMPPRDSRAEVNRLPVGELRSGSA